MSEHRTKLDIVFEEFLTISNDVKKLDSLMAKSIKISEENKKMIQEYIMDASKNSSEDLEKSIHLFIHKNEKKVWYLILLSVALAFLAGFLVAKYFFR